MCFMIVILILVFKVIHLFSSVVVGVNLCTYMYEDCNYQLIGVLFGDNKWMQMNVMLISFMVVTSQGMKSFIVQSSVLEFTCIHEKKSIRLNCPSVDLDRFFAFTYKQEEQSVSETFRNLCLKVRLYSLLQYSPSFLLP